MKQINIGNFALPVTQQPGPLIAFGQNIIEKGNFQIYCYTDFLDGSNKKFTEIAPSFVYAFRDDLSIFVEFPVALKYQEDGACTRSIEDLLFQLEYAFYTKETTTSIDQFTFVTNINVPSGLPLSEPPTGRGSPSFFIAFTGMHMDLDWYYFASAGPIITTTHDGTKFGDTFLYQLGLSKNVSYKSDAYIMNWMLEFSGIYRVKNKIYGVIDQDSGGNSIMLGPSMWLSTKKLIIQAGILWNISQHLYGSQNQDTFYAAINIAWTI